MEDKDALLGELKGTAAALALHEQGRLAARQRRTELVLRAREAGASHGEIAWAMKTSRAMSQYIVDTANKVGDTAQDTAPHRD